MQAETPLQTLTDQVVATRVEPGGMARLGQAWPGWAVLLDALDAEDWALKAVEPWLAPLLARADCLPPAHRYGWQAGLRRLWERQAWAMSPAVHEQLLQLAYAWDDWPLVLRIAEALAGIGVRSADADCMLARAYWHLGDSWQARQRLRPLLVQQPGNTAAYGLYLDIDAWCRYRAQYPFAGACLTDDGELCLEPLGEHHLRDFAWQYHDPSIAELCCLPCFDSGSDWVDWLRETYAYGDQLLFAVLHREWGLIGSVSLILHRGVGFFYYWVGAEFQGNGFGPQAVALMLRTAQENFGMHTCYAKAYADNYPSRRGLAKLGFEPVVVRPVPPHDAERFYRLGGWVPNEAAVEELRTLLGDMGSEVRLYDPLPSGSMDSIRCGNQY
jgi:RimJ/RimL family protein N-acetyltransferase